MDEDGARPACLANFERDLYPVADDFQLLLSFWVIDLSVFGVLLNFFSYVCFQSIRCLQTVQGPEAAQCHHPQQAAADPAPGEGLSI